MVPCLHFCTFSLVTAFTLSRRLKNSLTRSTLRTAYESKHSPGFHHTFTAPLEKTGATSLDANILFHGSSHDVSGPGIGIGPRLMVYSHPILPLAGQFLRIFWPEECKTPGTDVSIFYYLIFRRLLNFLMKLIFVGL